MSERRNRTSSATVIDPASCRHHWVIEAPNGATSAGRCKVCGMVRDFSNAGETIWEHRGMNASVTPKRAVRVNAD